MKQFMPIGYHLVVKPDKVEEKTKGGIFVPDSVRTVQEKAGVKGTITAIGPGAFDYDDSYKNGNELHVGDEVIFAKYSGMELPDLNEDGTQLVAINDKDIICKIVITE